MNLRYSLSAIVVALALVAAACGGGDATDTVSDAVNTDNSTQTAAPATDAPGIRVISAADGAEILDNAPADLVVLDVRTPEEFAEGHLPDAILVDFYSDDFAAQLGELDPDKPYLLYCRSGNRSGQTIPILEGLGFGDVADIDGGILSWAEAGLPIVTQ